MAFEIEQDFDKKKAFDGVIAGQREQQPENTALTAQIQISRELVAEIEATLENAGCVLGVIEPRPCDPQEAGSSPCLIAECANLNGRLRHLTKIARQIRDGLG